MRLSNNTEGGIDSSKYSDFVAFTSTFYQDDVEGQVRSEACFAMLDNAQKLGIRIVVGDGGSGPGFLEKVRGYPNVTLIDSGKGSDNADLTMGGERRFTGKRAMEQFPAAKYFLWLEPEKADLIKTESLDAILKPMRQGDASIIVPSRISMDTLPPQQRYTENRANKRAMDIVNNGRMGNTAHFTRREYGANAQRVFPGDPIGLMQHYAHYSDRSPYDLWFGPKAFTRDAMERYFLSYQGKKWDGNINPALLALKDDGGVVDVPVDFSYPPDQRSLEEDPKQAAKYEQKRRSQYRYILRTIRDMVKGRLGEGIK